MGAHPAGGQREASTGSDGAGCAARRAAIEYEMPARAALSSNLY